MSLLNAQFLLEQLSNKCNVTFPGKILRRSEPFEQIIPSASTVERVTLLRFLRGFIPANSKELATVSKVPNFLVWETPKCEFFYPFWDVDALSVLWFVVIKDSGHGVSQTAAPHSGFVFHTNKKVSSVCYRLQWFTSFLKSTLNWILHYIFIIYFKAGVQNKKKLVFIPTLHNCVDIIPTHLSHLIKYNKIMPVYFMKHRFYVILLIPRI